MSPITNAAAIFKKIPDDYPIPGETVVYDKTGTIDLDNVPLNGGTLLKILYLSMDPYLRGKMRDPKIESYSPAFKLNEPVWNDGVAVVLRSENDKYKTGEHVHGYFPFQEYAVVPSSTSLTVLPENGLPWQQYLGAAGMPGRTAWVAYHTFAHAQKGETIYISTAAGAVGSIVCQLAKAGGLKVIGSAGSDDKVKYLEDLGVDYAFNYKKESVADVLNKHGPLDIFWDHVGGETLEAALGNMNYHGRIISVGYISEYNKQAEYGVRNMSKVLTKALTISGFLLGYQERKTGNHDFYNVVPKMIKDGKLHLREQIVDGLENAGDLLLEVLKGTNNGKAVLKVAEK